MARNILKEMELLIDEIINKGFKTSEQIGSVMYKDFTKETLEKLLRYIQKCTWSNVDTVKFIAQNFMVGQSNLASVWSSMYPSRKPRTSPTMRNQYQNINHYLEAVLPEDLTEIFLLEKVDRLQELSLTIDSLYINDQRIELALGEQLICDLQDLPRTVKTFEVDECTYEISVLKQLSLLNRRNLLETCDKEKLAYIHQTVIRNPMLKGKINLHRFDFVRAFSVAEVDNIGISKSNEGIWEEAEKEIESIIEGVEPSDKVSSQVAQVLSDYILDNMKTRLSLLNPQELARVYQDLQSSEENKTSKLLNVFSKEEMQQYEIERLNIKRDYVKK